MSSPMGTKTALISHRAFLKEDSYSYGIDMSINTLSKPDILFLLVELLRTETNINHVHSVTITGEKEVKKGHTR